MVQTDEGVIEAMGPRETIAKAVALLCAEHDVGEDTAFEMMVQRSADSSERVRKVAATIVRQSTGAHDNASEPQAATRGPVSPDRVRGWHRSVTGLLVRRRTEALALALWTLITLIAAFFVIAKVQN